MQPERKDQPAHRALREHKDPLGQPEPRAHKGRLAPRAPKGQQDCSNHLYFWLEMSEVNRILWEMLPRQ